MDIKIECEEISIEEVKLLNMCTSEDVDINKELDETLGLSLTDVICSNNATNERDNILLEDPLEADMTYEAQLIVRQLAKRPSEKQKSHLLHFMETNIRFAKNQAISPVRRKLLWNTLIKQLNSLPGAKKSTAQWQRFWNDWRGNVKTKAKNIRKRQAVAAGSKQESYPRLVLGNLEGRLLKILSNSDFETPEIRLPQCSRIPNEEAQPQLKISPIAPADSVRKLAKRPSEKQRLHLLHFMETNIRFARNQLSSPERRKILWNTLTKQLNSLLGPKKSTEKWQKFWNDWRGNIKAKAKKIRMRQTVMGGSKQEVYPYQRLALGNLEGRLLNILCNGDVEIPEIRLPQCSRNPNEEPQFQPKINPTAPTDSGYPQRKLAKRPSEKQKSHLLHCMETNIRFARNQSGNSERRKVVWNILTKQLNSLPGAKKSTAQWQKFWNDWRCNIRSKARNIKMRQTVATGSKPELFPQPMLVLGNLEGRLLNILCSDDAETPENRLPQCSSNSNEEPQPHEKINAVALDDTIEPSPPSPQEQARNDLTTSEEHPDINPDPLAELEKSPPLEEPSIAVPQMPPSKKNPLQKRRRLQTSKKGLRIELLDVERRRLKIEENIAEHLGQLNKNLLKLIDVIEKK